MFGVERTLLVFKFSLNINIDIRNWISFRHSGSSFNNDKGRAKARDTATSMNMVVDMDTDPTYEDTTGKAVVASGFTTQYLDLGPNGALEVTKV